MARPPIEIVTVSVDGTIGAIPSFNFLTRLDMVDRRITPRASFEMVYPETLCSSGTAYLESRRNSPSAQNSYRWKAPGSTAFGAWVVAPAGTTGTINLPDGANPNLILRVKIIGERGIDYFGGVTQFELRWFQNFTFSRGAGSITPILAAQHTPRSMWFAKLGVRNSAAATLGPIRAYLHAGDAPEATLMAGYPVQGGFSVACSDVSGWPLAGLMRNETTNEVLYYTGRSPSEISVRAQHRHQQGWVPSGGGIAGQRLRRWPRYAIAAEAPTAGRIQVWPRNEQPYGVPLAAGASFPLYQPLAFTQPLNSTDALTIPALSPNAAYGLWIQDRIPNDRLPPGVSAENDTVEQLNLVLEY